MKTLLKWVALCLVLVIVAAALTAAWYLRWDELPPPDLPGVVEGGTLLHNERERSWMAYVPASRSSAPPLLLVFHGSQSEGAGMRAGSFFSFDVVAERAGFVVAYPDGFENHWNDCRASASYSANRQQIDDVGFVRALIERLAGRYGIDRSRVYVTGLSNGGQMAYRLALEAPDLVAGAAAIVANLPVASNSDCSAAGEPVPVMVINGSEDPVNPHEGGVVEILGDRSRGEVLSSLDSARYWAQLAGYGPAPSSSQTIDSNPDDDTALELLRWEAPGRVPVQLVSVLGGGHTFPHPVYSLPRLLGRTSHEVDGAELIWEFFEAIP